MHWFFVVSLSLFVGGIVFVVAGARQTRQPPTTPKTAQLANVATVKQIMNGVVDPASNAVFNAVSSEISAAGIVEKAPQTDAEWQKLGDQAAALAEAGNLLLVGGRQIDTGDWTSLSREMTKVSTDVLRATEAKDKDKVFDLGEALYLTCDNCHRKYQRGS